MDRRLLVVEDMFHIHGRGLVVWPLVPFDALPHLSQMPIRRTVTLRRPNHSIIGVEAIFTIGTCVPPDRAGYDCLLLGVGKADVPSGTEVWVSDSVAVP
jgi:hypothetical protein